MSERNIALFINTHESMRAEMFLRLYGIDFKTVIKPRSITSECGMGLEFNGSDEKKVTEICKDNHLKLEGIFLSKENGTWERKE
ncbi:MAG: DUF3343 domain-containing protein [Nitrospinota bacterium]